MLKDPVCGMAVDEKSPLRSMHEGQTYVFCSSDCKTKFDEEPGQYTTLGAAGVEGRNEREV